MMCRFLAALTCIILTPFGGGAAEQQDVSSILESFVTDYRTDHSAWRKPLTFGVEVKDEGAWHVISDGEGGVELRSGPPQDPAFIYVTDRVTLERISHGEIAALTAMGRARWSDPAPMELRLMEGFEPDPDFMGRFAELTFHFWTTGQPEIVPFGDPSHTRVVHGANVAVLYYRPGLRTAWYQIETGQHINAEEKDQTNPFPTLIVMTAGSAEARIGGRRITLESGTCTFIPARVSHELWNPLDEPAEFVIIMFGEGA
jgi:mannose-6-phosphate isomerase-like protein (cupin superfamily)